MVNLLVRHSVKDFADWKKVFDEHATFREEHGCQGGELYQNAENPNEVVIRFSWDSLDNAREFVDSKGLREAMDKAGVLGAPTVTVLNEVQTITR